MKMAWLVPFILTAKNIRFLIYLNKFYNNDDTFGIQIRIWKNLQDILDDIHR